MRKVNVEIITDFKLHSFHFAPSHIPMGKNLIPNTNLTATRQPSVRDKELLVICTNLNLALDYSTSTVLISKQHINLSIIGFSLRQLI